MHKKYNHINCLIKLISSHPIVHEVKPKKR